MHRRAHTYVPPCEQSRILRQRYEAHRREGYTQLEHRKRQAANRAWEERPVSPGQLFQIRDEGDGDTTGPVSPRYTVGGSVTYEGMHAVDGTAEEDMDGVEGVRRIVQQYNLGRARQQHQMAVLRGEAPSPSRIRAMGRERVMYHELTTQDAAEEEQDTDARMEQQDVQSYCPITNGELEMERYERYKNRMITVETPPPPSMLTWPAYKPLSLRHILLKRADLVVEDAQRRLHVKFRFKADPSLYVVGAHPVTWLGLFVGQAWEEFTADYNDDLYTLVTKQRLGGVIMGVVQRFNDTHLLRTFV